MPAELVIPSQMPERLHLPNERNIVNEISHLNILWFYLDVLLAFQYKQKNSKQNKEVYTQEKINNE